MANPRMTTGICKHRSVLGTCLSNRSAITMAIVLFKEKELAEGIRGWWVLDPEDHFPELASMQLDWERQDDDGAREAPILLSLSLGITSMKLLMRERRVGIRQGQVELFIQGARMPREGRVLLRPSPVGKRVSIKTSASVSASKKHSATGAVRSGVSADVQAGGETEKAHSESKKMSVDTDFYQVYVDGPETNPRVFIRSLPHEPYVDLSLNCARVGTVRLNDDPSFCRINATLRVASHDVFLADEEFEEYAPNKRAVLRLFLNKQLSAFLSRQVAGWTR